MSARLLEGQVSLVTGGSRGLGRELCYALARAGSDVIVTSRNVDQSAEVAMEIKELTGRRALPFGCHVGRWDEIDALVEFAYSSFGRIDILVNNAGMSPRYPSLVDVSEELFAKTIGVNLSGPFRLCASVGQRMFEAEGGKILNIGSIAAVRPRGVALPYAAAKAGLNALTTGFAQAYGPRVRVNSIMCGPFETDISRAWSTEERLTLTARAALDRIGQPEEVVGAALYLVGPHSTYTTGAIVRVDGGIL